MNAATEAWADLTRKTRRDGRWVPTDEDRRIVAEYNARGDKERYGPHFADLEGMAEVEEQMAEEAELIEWLAAQASSDFAQSLVEAHGKFGSLTDKQFEAAKRMRAQATTKPETTETTVDVAELAEWLSQQTWSEFALSLASFYKDRGYLSEKQIAAAQKMRAKTGAPKAESTMLTTDGMFFKDDTVYKVQFSASKRLYAKRLTESGWEYKAQGPLHFLTEDDRLTYEKAQEYGQLYGVCAVCGATLTDEDSIARGIGPICAQKF